MKPQSFEVVWNCWYCKCREPIYQFKSDKSAYIDSEYIADLGLTNWFQISNIPSLYKNCKIPYATYMLLDGTSNQLIYCHIHILHFTIKKTKISKEKHRNADIFISLTISFKNSSMAFFFLVLQCLIISSSFKTH